MKVYAKSKDKMSIGPGLIVFFVFLFFSIYVIYYIVTSHDSFIQILSFIGDAIFFAIGFMIFDILFVYSLLKRPQPYRAKLIDKHEEDFKGQKITAMKFKVGSKSKHRDEMIKDEYECYTKKENNLVVGNEYSLSIKELNWNLKYVDEIKDESKLKENVPNTDFGIVFLFFAFICSGDIFLSILGIIYYPIYMGIYLAVLLFSCFMLYLVLKMRKDWQVDNNEIKDDNQNYDSRLQRIKPLKPNKKINNNMRIISLILTMFLVAIIWWYVIDIKMHVPSGLFMLAYSMVLVPEIPLLIIIIHSVGYDKKLMKKNNVVSKKNVDISKIKTFSVLRASSSETFPEYFIIDQNRNLIFKMKTDNFMGTKFVICNSNNIRMCEIILDSLSMNEFTINIVGEFPFIIRSRVQVKANNYKVIGRDYYIEGDDKFLKNTIYTNEGKEVATVLKSDLGSSKVVLNNGFKCDIDIIIMALCITRGNFVTLIRRRNI